MCTTFHLRGQTDACVGQVRQLFTDFVDTKATSILIRTNQFPPESTYYFLLFHSWLDFPSTIGDRTIHSVISAVLL